jgi:Lrp/AsnC family leucine-responsive transcriptional regulator
MGTEIDGTDREIVELLLADGRRTLADIGSAVGLSAPAVKRRLARLEELAVILGYTARVDHAKLGEPIEAFTELRFAGDTEVSAIAGVADGVSEVDTIYTIAGDPDALVHLRVRDLAGLTRAIDKLRRSGRVTGTKTLMVLDTHEPRAESVDATHERGGKR